MFEQTQYPDDEILVSSAHSFLLLAEAVLFQWNVDLTKYKRDHIEACLDLSRARRCMYEAAVDDVIKMFSDAVDMAVYHWSNEEELSYDKLAKDVFIQRLSYELPDRLEIHFQKLRLDSIAAVDKHFSDLQNKAGLSPVAFDCMDLRGYQKDWTGLFLELATEVIIDRIDKMKLDKKLTGQSRESDRYIRTFLEICDRTNLECLRIRDRMICKLKGVKPFSEFSSCVSKNVLAWACRMKEDDNEVF